MNDFNQSVKPSLSFIREIITESLDNQERFIKQIQEPFSQKDIFADREEIYQGFTRRIFFLKEILLQYKDVLTKEDLTKIYQSIKAQTDKIEKRYFFLQRSLNRVIR